MSQNQPTTNPLFSIGDLVTLRGFGFLLTNTGQEIGIISSHAYSFKSIESYHDLVYFEWWCYDVLIAGQLITMMPENFLLEVKVNEN